VQSRRKQDYLRTIGILALGDDLMFDHSGVPQRMEEILW
jgi:hypothetical protein